MKKHNLRDLIMILIASTILALCFSIKAGGSSPKEDYEEIYYNESAEIEVIEGPILFTEPPETVDNAQVIDPPEAYEDEYISLGEFEVTAYSLAEGSGCGLTKSGTVPRLNYTVAVDPDVIPLGSIIVIDGVDYVAEDTGGLVKGRIVDIFVEDTETAIQFGRQVKEVLIKEAPNRGQAN